MLVMSSKKAQKNSTKKTKLIHPSVQAGRRLAEWLNSTRSENHPVRKAILEMQEALNFARMAGESVWADEEEEEMRTAIEIRAGQIRRVTKRYPFFFDPIPQAGGTLLVPTSLRDGRAQWDGCHALADWRALEQWREQWRLRRCEQCGVYFCAKRRDQVYYPPDCNQKYKLSDPKYKEGRRKYAEKRHELSFRSDPKKEEKLAKLMEKRARRAAREKARIKSAAAVNVIEEMRTDNEARDRRRHKC
jgi:hypothetical protein